MPSTSSPLPLWIYRVLLFVGGATLVGFSWVYVGEPHAVDPLAGRLAIGFSALSLGVLTFTSRVVRGHAYTLVYALFFIVSAWQIYVATAGGLTATAAFGVLLVFLGCSAGIQSARMLAGYTVVFVGTAAAASFAIEAPEVPRVAFLSTLGALGALGVFVARAREEAVRSLHDAKEAALGAARAKSEFLAAMSHEIRTPLNGVIGMTEILATTPLTPDQRDYVGTIQASGRALLGVINDVLDFSKIEAGRLVFEAEPVALRALADDAVAVIAPTASQKGVEVVCHVGPAVPATVLADGARLRQVALNLLSNAVKFTPSGTVTLQVDARSRRGVAEIRLTVADTGIGIPAEHLPTLFDSFTQVDASTTRRFGGTGLGLAITKRLVEQMGGEVHVESRVGAGSEFEVTVPLPEVEGPPAPPTDAGAVLLLADAHDGARAAVTTLAEGAGFSVRAFGSEADVEAYLEGGGRYDLAALALPGLDAFALAERLRREPGVGGRPLVLLAPISASVASPGLFDAVIAKPVRADRFADVAARLTGRAGLTVQPEPLAQAGPARVLLVEDHDVNRKVAVGLLRRIGVVPDVAEDGAQALEALRHADYDLVLMDLQMPVLDGLEATRRLRAELPPERQPRVVALTANAFAEDAARCREAGMDGFLAKPVRLEDLRAEVARVAAEPDGAPPAAEAPTRPALPVEARPVEAPAAVSAVEAPGAVPGPTPVPAPSAIAAHLRALCDGDEALAAEILDAYLRTERALVADLAGDALGEAAHKLKSATGTLGADALSHAAHELERRARSGEGAAAAAADLVRGLDRLREAATSARALLGASSEASA